MLYVRLKGFWWRIMGGMRHCRFGFGYDLSALSLDSQVKLAG